MELEENNRINFYKQVAPTGLFWKISFSCLGVSKPLIMRVYRENRKTEAWCQGAAKSRDTLTYPRPAEIAGSR